MTDREKITAQFVLKSLKSIGMPPCGTNEFESPEIQRACVKYDVLLKATEEQRSALIELCREQDHEAFAEFMKIKPQLY